jgi:4,5-DOPA dioxygenase extradiol
MRRRDSLRLLTAGGAAAALPFSPSLARARGKKMSTTARMPTIFLAHGAPPLLDDAGWMSELRAWSRLLPRPRSVLMLSAHWERRPVTLGATEAVPLVHDFYNFPRRYYEMKYPAPGAPALAARVRGLLAEAGQPVADEPGRGLDHGAYIPMMAMYPDADVPVLQASLPTLDPRSLFDLGRRLAPLREEGVLIVGSGFLIHNLRAVDFSEQPRTPQWALEFDDFCAEKLFKGDADALMDYRSRAPGVKLALPTHEHFVPVLVAMGAADPGSGVTFPITGFWGGSLTRRSTQFG